MLRFSHPLVLGLVAALIVRDAAAMKAAAAPSESSGEVDKEVEELKDAGCLPSDFVPPEFPECDRDDRSPLVNMNCVAISSGIVNATGYTEEGAKAFIDSMTEDEKWREGVKELLDVCAITTTKLEMEKQGVFTVSCLGMLMKFHCDAKRVGDAVEEVAGEDAKGVGQALVYMAEGSCANSLVLPKKKQAWTACAAENNLKMQVFAEAGKRYVKFVHESEELNADEEDIAELSKQMQNFNNTMHCTMKAIGEITAAGQLDFDVIRANLNNSVSVREDPNETLKAAAGVILDICQQNMPATPDQFVTCWFGNLPNVCTTMNALAVAFAPEVAEKQGGCGTGGGRAGGRKQRRRKQRRGRRFRQRRRQQQQQQQE